MGEIGEEGGGIKASSLKSKTASMSNKKERECIERYRDYTKETACLLSNHKWMEKAVCAALLRCLGIDFCEDEILSPRDDPPDIMFRDARFEVCEILDENRKRDDELKKEIKRPSDLLDKYIPPEPMAWADLIALVNNALGKKAARYSPDVCAGLDALVYVNLKNKYLEPDSSFPAVGNLDAQGWRSVSVLMGLYAQVICAKSSAPEFLRGLIGQTKSGFKYLW